MPVVGVTRHVKYKYQLNSFKTSTYRFKTIFAFINKTNIGERKLMLWTSVHLDRGIQKTSPVSAHKSGRSLDMVNLQFASTVGLKKILPVKTQKFLTLLKVEIAPQAKAMMFVREVIVMATPLIFIMVPILFFTLLENPACISPDSRINMSSTPIPRMHKHRKIENVSACSLLLLLHY